MDPLYRHIREQFDDVDPPELIAIRKAASDANKVLERVPGYARAQRLILERDEVEFEARGKHLPRPMVPTDERLAYELSIFDIGAEELLQLVHNLETHRAYDIVLECEAAIVWELYRGIAGLDALPDHPAVQRIDSHKYKWLLRSWKKVEDAENQVAQAQASSDGPLNSLAERMEAVSRPTGIDEFCRLAGISRGTYFNIQNGVPVKPKTLAKIGAYMKSTESTNPVQNESK